MEELNEYELEARVNKDACNHALLGVISHLKFVQDFTNNYKLDDFIGGVIGEIEEWTNE